MVREKFPVVFGVLLLVGCQPAEDDPFSSFNPTLTGSVTFTNGDDLDTEEGDGDGDTSDGDMPGDGDGDGESGDGDGDGDGDGEPGDGDGEPGDGDGDPGCEWTPNPDQNPNAACDPILQDCPANEKCVAFGNNGGNWDDNKCVPVMGDQAPGEACTVDNIESSLDNCDEQSQCFNLDQDNNGICLPFCGCTYEEPACPVGSGCLVSNVGSIALCVDSCDPLLQDCPFGQACYPSGELLLCFATTSDLPPGEPCGYLNDCEPGTACVNVPECGGACCSPFCDVDGNDSECAVLPGTTCTAVNDWGVCA